MIKLSVAIITYNEEANIGRCLESVWEIADEIVVLDSFSTDQTQAIARSFGAKIYEHSFEGFARQRQMSIDHCTYDTILAIDADEVLSDLLKESIASVKSNWTHHAYTCNRLNNYCGRWIRHGTWYPDKKLRLFHRDHAAMADRDPHEVIEVKPGIAIQHLTGDLLHYSYKTPEEFVRTNDRYSTMQAESFHRQGKKASLIQHLYKPFWRFFKSYVVKRGFLDGKDGWIIAVGQAQAVNMRLNKMRALQKGVKRNGG